jgi:hypothetical protein
MPGRPSCCAAHKNGKTRQEEEEELPRKLPDTMEKKSRGENRKRDRVSSEFVSFLTGE